MKPTSLAAIVSILLSLFAAHRAQAHAALRDDKPAPAKDTRQQADQALLLQAFKGLEEELKAALADYQAGIQDARSRNLPREAWPKVPTPEFFARFEELALKDQPDSLRWCLGTVTMMGLSIDETNARKDVYYQRIVHVHPNSPWIKDIVHFLQAEAAPTGLGIDRAVPLLDYLADNSKAPGVPSLALLTKAQVYQKSPKPEHQPLYRKSLEDLVQKFPQSEEGKRAKGFLFQLDNLAVGKVAPEFKVADVDGVEFKLSDYRGKVVVLDFWGFWCPNCVSMIPLEKEMVERLKNEPFALLGIDTDQKKEDFRKLAQERGVTWRNAWQGSTTGPLCIEWGIASFPTLFVLDSKGVIRYTGVRGEELSKAVDTLLAELRGSSEKKDDPKARESKGGG